MAKIPTMPTIPLQNLSARLGESTARGISGAGQALQGMLTQRINAMEQERLKEQERANSEKFIKGFLPPELQETIGKSYALGSEKEKEMLLRSLITKAENEAFAKQFMPQQDINGEEVIPEDDNAHAQPAFKNKVLQQSFEDKLLQNATQFTQQRPQPSPETEQLQKKRNELQNLQEKDRATREGFWGGLLQGMGEGIGKLLGINPTQAPEIYSQEIQNLDKEIAEAPIKEGLDPQARMKAAAEFTAYQKLLKNPQFFAEPDQLPQLGAIAEAMAGNKGNVTSLLEYLSQGAIKPNDYLRLRNLNLAIDREGRQWVGDKFKESITEGERAEAMLDNIRDIESLLNSGATVGAGQKILSSLGIDPVIFGNDETQILNKVLSMLVAQTPEFNSGRSSNMKLGVIKAIKPDIFMKPKAIRAIIDQFRYGAEIAKAKRAAWAREAERAKRTGQAMDATSYERVNRELDPMRDKFAADLRKKWREAGIDVGEPETISDAAYNSANLIPVNKMPNGSEAIYKGQRVRIMNGKMYKI